jgi:2-C-methyl-D-erythritol 2,4-cyclodiphosphate synthase
MPIRVGIGQDSHRFSRDPASRLILGGIEIGGVPGLVANSDGDPVFHALCNALATVTGFRVLGPYADLLCREQGVTDSSIFLTEAVSRLDAYRITSVSIAVECKRPHLEEHLEAMKARVSELLKVDAGLVVITVTSGDELTPFGEGRGIQAFAAVTAIHKGLWGEK